MLESATHDEVGKCLNAMASTDGKELRRIRDALVSAFSDRDLEEMLLARMNVTLYDVVGKGGFNAVVFELVRWADSEGKLQDLVCKALEEKPGNQNLRTIAADFSCSQSDIPVGQTKSVDRSRTAIWALLGWALVAVVEYLNRHYLHLLRLYPDMLTAGMIWTLLAAPSSFVHVFGFPSRRWLRGLAVWCVFVVSFFVLDRILLRSSDINPAAVEWFMPFLYGCSFAALSWSFTAAFGVDGRQRHHTQVALDVL